MDSESSLTHPIDCKDLNTIKAQKYSKEIVKIIHVTSVVSTNSLKLWEYFLCAKKTTIDFKQQFVSSVPHYSGILERITYVNNVCCSVSTAPYADMFFTLFTLWSERKKTYPHSYVAWWYFIVRQVWYLTWQYPCLQHSTPTNTFNLLRTKTSYIILT